LPSKMAKRKSGSTSVKLFAVNWSRSEKQFWFCSFAKECCTTTTQQTPQKSHWKKMILWSCWRRTRVGGGKENYEAKLEHFRVILWKKSKSLLK
jgi:hypothetical protein